MTYQTPCSRPGVDPDDFFIGRGGSEYSDEPLATDQDAVDHLNQVDPNGTRSETLITQVREQMEAERKKVNLIKRRKAKESCGECYVREHCFDIALNQPDIASYGTWGGYYEEELRKIRDEKARQDRVREKRLKEKQDAKKELEG